MDTGAQSWIASGSDFCFFLNNEAAAEINYSQKIVITHLIESAESNRFNQKLKMYIVCKINK